FAWAGVLLIVNVWLAIALWAGIGGPRQGVTLDVRIALTVTVRPLGDRPIRSVSAEAFDSREDADNVRETTCPPTTKLFSATQHPCAGPPPVLDVQPSSRSRWYGPVERPDVWFQYRWLVVIVEYEDGERVAKLVAIPDLRKRRQVAVEFP